jgi:hypothetical protein
VEADWRDWDWTRIGLYLEAERGTASRPEVAAAIGADPESIYNIETNRRAPKRRKPPTAVALARYYGWTPSSLETVGLGGEPTKAEPAQGAIEQILDGAEENAGEEGPRPLLLPPLAEEDREVVIAVVNASKAVSDETKRRVVKWLRQRADPDDEDPSNGMTG